MSLQSSVGATHSMNDFQHTNKKSHGVMSHLRKTEDWEEKQTNEQTKNNLQNVGNER